MLFLVSLVVDGALAGAIYALVALAFVVVYKASRVINFALGEWVLLASVLVATGLNVLGLGFTGATLLGCLGMLAMAFALSRLVLRRMVGRPLISILMVTLGLGILLRGLVQIAFADVPKGLALPVPTAPFVVGDLYVSSERLLAAVVASLAIAAVAWLQHRSRTGLALRAVADDQQAAMAVGIDVGFHHMLAWGAAGLVCVVAGILWALVTGGGIGLGLIGLKIFPIVIIGGLDSIAGTIVAAILIGVIESLATGYLEPYLGSGCAVLVTYGALLVMLLVRPAGLFGVRRIERV